MFLNLPTPPKSSSSSPLRVCDSKFDLGRAKLVQCVQEVRGPVWVTSNGAPAFIDRDNLKVGRKCRLPITSDICYARLFIISLFASVRYLRALNHQCKEICTRGQHTEPPAAHVACKPRAQRLSVISSLATCHCDHLQARTVTGIRTNPESYPRATTAFRIRIRVQQRAQNHEDTERSVSGPIVVRTHGHLDMDVAVGPTNLFPQQACFSIKFHCCQRHCTSRIYQLQRYQRKGHEQ